MTCLLPFVETRVRRADRLEPARAGRPGPSAVAGTDPPRAGHLQPLDHRGLARRGGRRSDRRPRAAGARRRLLPRHRQDAQAGLLRREPRARATTATIAGAGHEHAGDHRPHEGRRRPGPAAQPARADHRLHPAASRHDAGRVFLSPGRARASKATTPTAATRSTKARSAIPARSRRRRRPAC